MPAGMVVRNGMAISTQRFICTGLLASGICLAGEAAFADVLSNRHHLRGCTHQSAPVIIPHADARTVQLGLPATLNGTVQIEQIYGEDEQTRIRQTRRSLSIETQRGGAVMTVMPVHPC